MVLREPLQADALGMLVTGIAGWLRVRLAQLHQPKLGELPLSRFDKFLLQTHFNELAAANYSEWVIKRAKTLHSSIFIEAVDLGFLAANPMAKVKLPRCKVTEKPVIPREDVMRLYAAIPALRDRLMFRIGVFLGARASELFGLAADC